MRVENTKIKLTIPIPVNKPDANGVIYTKESVEKAISNLGTKLPIVYQDNACDAQVIGVTTGNAHIVTWDSENQVYKVTVDGVVFYGGAAIIVNEIEDGKISDFQIVSIGLTT